MSIFGMELPREDANDPTPSSSKRVSIVALLSPRGSISHPESLADLFCWESLGNGTTTTVVVVPVEQVDPLFLYEFV
jgi:hypothetical protein